MYAVRLWSVRHAKGLNAFYRAFEEALIALHPLWNKICLLYTSPSPRDS